MSGAGNNEATTAVKDKHRANACSQVCRIVMACDESYAMPLATTLKSLVASNPYTRFDVTILFDEFSERERDLVRRSLLHDAIELGWTQVDLQLFGLCTTNQHVSKITFARLLVPHIVGTDVKRVLYLDSDILVLGDIIALWDMDLDDAVIGAVVDGLDCHLKADDINLQGYPRVTDYFNAGVLLIDVAKWCEENITQKALKYIEEHPRSPMADQDALNVACDGRWMHLNTRWNYQAHFDRRFADILPSERPAIVHFVTASKPWIPQSCSLNVGLYDDFRKQTVYARKRSTIIKDNITREITRVKNWLVRAFL